MLIRCAFFRGRIRPGSEAAFSSFVEHRLVPLWSSFPGASEVRVLRQVDSDVAEPHLEMVLSIAYPDRAAMDRAMASPVRGESRTATQHLMTMFDGDIVHTLFDADEHALAVAGEPGR